jgi:glycosyltransferase involved in cell wall biosynthesis
MVKVQLLKYQNLCKAMACGTPVVSTDCPHGPREILEDGRWETLVPVGDVEALGRGILHTLSKEQDRDGLRSRAEQFSIKAAVEAYLRALGVS